MSLKLKVIQPTRTVIDTECEHVIIPGIDGDFGVSEDHTPFITKIRVGNLIVYHNNTKGVERFAIHDGFVTVENNVIRIVCEVIERSDEIDFKRAEQAKKRAEERMASSDTDIDYRRAESSLKRALSRIQALSDH